MASPQVNHKKLLSQENGYLQDRINQTIPFCVGEVTRDGFMVPRYGVLSLMLGKMPVYVYDNEEFTNYIGCRTGFTDFIHIWLHADFIRDCFNEDDKKGTDNDIFLLLHEVSHALLNHHQRAMEFDARSRNIGFDKFINAMLQKDYCGQSGLVAGEVLRIGVGFEDGYERYLEMSEEQIVREVFREQQNNPPPPSKGGGQGPNTQGQQGGQQPTGNAPRLPGMNKPNAAGQQPNGTQPGQGQPGQDGQQGQQPGDQGSGQGSGQGLNGQDDNHIPDLNKLREALEAAGLGHVIEIVDIPRDAESAAKAMEEQDLKIGGEISKVRDMVKNGAPVPGAHVNAVAFERYKEFHKPKVTFKGTVAKMVYGNGMKSAPTNDVPSKLVPAYRMAGQRIYMGTRVPVKPDGVLLCLLDTSGSMSGEEIHKSLSEIVGVVSRNPSTAPTVLVGFADTRLRGELLELNKKTLPGIVKKGIDAMGRGGTDLHHCIDDAYEHPKVKEAIAKGKLMGTIYFSDLGDRVPQMKHPKPFVYMATPGTYNDHFANEAKRWGAETFSMGEKMEVNLSKRGAMKI